jgi:hypothetical protein
VKVVKYILGFILALFALAASMIVGVLVFGTAGSLLFHGGLMSVATLFVFPWYGLIPGFVAGAVWSIKILVPN